MGMEGIELSLCHKSAKGNWKPKSRSVPHFLHMQLRSLVGVGEKFIQRDVTNQILD